MGTMYYDMSQYVGPDILDLSQYIGPYVTVHGPMSQYMAPIS